MLPQLFLMPTLLLSFVLLQVVGVALVETDKMIFGEFPIFSPKRFPVKPAAIALKNERVLGCQSHFELFQFFSVATHFIPSSFFVASSSDGLRLRIYRSVVEMRACPKRA